MKSNKLIVSLVLFVCIGGISAQTENGISLVEEATIESTVLNEERNIRIYFPRDYHSSDIRYPVLYLLDGGTHFQHAVSAVNFLKVHDKTPDMIIVAIINVDRNRDFSPVHDEGALTSGGAEKFLEFVSDELVANMDRDFRTSGFNILMGHSLGGTFATYALFTKPEIFDAYIAISPYLQFADNYLVNKSLESLKPYEDKGKYFYMTVGNEPDYYQALDAFSSAMKLRTEGTVDFKYDKMLSEDHSTVPYISLFNGLRFVFSEWEFPREKLQIGLEAVDAHYVSVSSKYGYEIKTPENIINLLGYTHLQNNEIERAIYVFKENVKRYSGSANVYDSLGDAYENDIQYKLAAKNYQKAYELGLELNDPNTAIYKRNMERVQK